MIYALIVIGQAHAAWLVNMFEDDRACIKAVIELYDERKIPKDRLFCVPIPKTLDTQGKVTR